MKLFTALILSSAALALTGCGVKSVTECTMEPKESWLDQQEFQSKLRADGYDIAEFKVTEGNCYEIYGRNSDGQKVEIYFNPVDGSIVKQEME